MDWITKLERKFGRFAISGVMKYLIILQIGGYFILMMQPLYYYMYLSLDASAILNGQVWRIITFLMYPPTTSIIFIFFAFYLYYMIGESLEHIWGTFRFNMYILMGIIFHVVGALLALLLTGVSFPLGTQYLYFSLFFAFAASFPDMQFLLFFVIPVKAKYLGMLNGAYFAYTVLQGILPSYTESASGVFYQSNAIAAFVSILNFLVFYFTSRSFKKYSPKQMMRKQKFKSDMKKARRPEVVHANGAKHKCSVCGRTELDDPALEFRYCSKCSGNHEYCQEHLFTHQHIK